MASVRVYFNSLIEEFVLGKDHRVVEDERSSITLTLRHCGKPIILHPSGQMWYIEFSCDIETVPDELEYLIKMFQKASGKSAVHLLTIRDRFLNDGLKPGRYGKEVQHLGLCGCQWNRCVWWEIHLDYDPADPRYMRMRMQVPCEHHSYKAYGELRRHKLEITEAWYPEE